MGFSRTNIEASCARTSRIQRIFSHCFMGASVRNEQAQFLFQSNFHI
jgi:hypothetical protein